MLKAKGIIDDGVIEVIDLGDLPETNLSAIPVEHRTRFFNPRELDAIVYLLRSHAVQSVVEIGCQNGRTAKAILTNVRTILRYTGVDVPPGVKLACDVQRNEIPERAGELALDDDRFFLLLSKKGSEFAHSMLAECDAVFIDGDHSYEAVKRDHALAMRIVRPGGLIIHHDYHDLGTVGVKPALQELAQTQKFYHVKDTWLCYTQK